jgi:glyoxylase-like metal-dependent hydrolase (beta-lactamase superfamily II)
MTSRRGFLRSTLGTCWSGAALLEQSVFRANQARAQATPEMPSLFDIQKVADGAYAAIAKRTAVLNCNAAIFENSEDLLIVDTHSKPSAVVSLIAQLQREVTRKPVRYIVNSHFHWDHSQGTSAYKEANPQVHIIASEATRRLLSENGATRLKQSLEQMRSALEETEKLRGSSKDAAEIRRLSDHAAGIRSYIAEMNDYTPELPNVTFDRELILHDKHHELHIAFRGRAHTSGDVVVFCPQSKVVATGDMVHGSLPFIGDGYPSEWPGTMRSVTEFPFDYLIGGHGPVQHGQDTLRNMAAYIEEVTARVARHRDKPLAELQSAITPAKLKSLSGEYGKYLMQNLGVNSIDALSPGVRTNIAHIHGRLGAA